ncbi:MAG: flagellar hook-length control protein FliK [candidate division Zixibacteria bacterium]|nr:flagellar hook-length control protein FliK [candidate division Zixibacteria bacterium]
MLLDGQSNLVSVEQSTEKAVYVDEKGFYHLPIELKFSSDSKQLPEFTQTAELVFSQKDLSNPEISQQDLNIPENNQKIELPANLVIKIEEGNVGLENLLDNLMIAKGGNTFLQDNIVSSNNEKTIDLLHPELSQKTLTLPVVVKLDMDTNLTLDMDTNLTNEDLIEAQSDKKIDFSQMENLVDKLKELKGNIEIKVETLSSSQVKGKEYPILCKDDSSTESNMNLKTEPFLFKGPGLVTDKNSQFSSFEQSKNDYSPNPQVDGKTAPLQKEVTFDKNIFSEFPFKFKEEGEGKSEGGKILLNDLWGNSKSEKLGIENLQFSKNSLFEVERIQSLTEDVLARIRTSIFNLKDSYRSEARIKLEPESLGSVKVHLISENSNISAKIVVDNVTTKQIIQSNLSQLKDGLSQQGLNLEKCDISLGQEGKGDLNNAKTWSGQNWGNRDFIPTSSNDDLNSLDASFAASGNNYVLNYLA